MGYYIYLSAISLDEYQEKLKIAWLPPSRILLKEDLQERFDLIRNAGIKIVKELQDLLKKNHSAKFLPNQEY